MLRNTKGAEKGSLTLQTSTGVGTDIPHTSGLIQTRIRETSIDHLFTTVLSCIALHTTTLLVPAGGPIQTLDDFPLGRTFTVIKEGNQRFRTVNTSPTGKAGHGIVLVTSEMSSTGVRGAADIMNTLTRRAGGWTARSGHFCSGCSRFSGGSLLSK